MKRILSVIVAVVASTAGHIVLWIGGATSLVLTQRGFEASPAAIIGIVFGILLIAVAMLTVAWSSLGVVVIGVLQVVVTLTIGLPPRISPVVQLSQGVRRFGQELSYGMDYTVLTGVSLLTGALFIAAGLAARKLRTPAGATRGVAATVVALLAGVIGLVLGLTAGYLNFQSLVVFLRGADPVAFVLLLLAAVLLAIAVLSARWSVVGVVVLGAIVVVIGVLEVATRFLFSLPRIRGVQEGLDTASQLGNVQLIGVLLIAAGVGLWLRVRRSPEASPVLAPGAAPEVV